VQHILEEKNVLMSIAAVQFFSEKFLTERFQLGKFLVVMGD
jgi:hypothetical protein